MTSSPLESTGSSDPGEVARTHGQSFSDAPIELPPVDPPSARFIFQLFVIPFLVVVVLVCVLLLVYGLFGKIAGSSRDALDYVQTIRAGNENRRWRAAYELASLIHNEPELARDASLQNSLSTLLLDELKRPKEHLAPETPQYLALALGAFDQIEGSSQPALVAALGDDVPAPVRAAAAQSVARQAAKPGSSLSADVFVPALISATHDKETDPRQHAAYALGYFPTPEARAALAKCAEDDNRLVRYNAAVSLARLDDEAGLGVLREMLSTRDLEGAFASELKDKAGPTRTMIEAVQIEALGALDDAARAGKTTLANTVVEDLRLLAASDSKPVQVEARNLLQKLQAPKLGESLEQSR